MFWSLSSLQHGNPVSKSHLLLTPIPWMPLSPIQKTAIRYLASGWGNERVGKELKVSAGQVKKWKATDPEFQRELELATIHHADMVEAMLIEGERKAAETLIEALKAESRGGPNWTVRLNAALSLLDRAGQRGRAVEKQQIAQVVARAQPDVEESLRRALRDPGVRSWLKASGKEVEKLLPSAETIVAIEADLNPSDPLSAPLNLLPEKTA